MYQQYGKSEMLHSQETEDNIGLAGILMATQF